MGGCGGPERTDFNNFYFGNGLQKNLSFSLYFGSVWSREMVTKLHKVCVVLERTDFQQFLLWEGVVVLKELIFNSLYFGRVWYSLLILTVSILGGCGGLERTDFQQFLL